MSDERRFVPGTIVYGLHVGGGRIELYAFVRAIPHRDFAQVAHAIMVARNIFRMMGIPLLAPGVGAWTSLVEGCEADKRRALARKARLERMN